MNIIVDRIDSKFVKGRTEGDALDIDGKVYVVNNRKNIKLKQGQIIKVKVVKALPYDLIGEI